MPDTVLAGSVDSSSPDSKPNGVAFHSPGQLLNTPIDGESPYEYPFPATATTSPILSPSGSCPLPLPPMSPQPIGNDASANALFSPTAAPAQGHRFALPPSARSPPVPPSLRGLVAPKPTDGATPAGSGLDHGTS